MTGRYAVAGLVAVVALPLAMSSPSEARDLPSVLSTAADIIDDAIIDGRTRLITANVSERDAATNFKALVATGRIPHAPACSLEDAVDAAKIYGVAVRTRDGHPAELTIYGWLGECHPPGWSRPHVVDGVRLTDNTWFLPRYRVRMISR